MKSRTTRNHLGLYLTRIYARKNATEDPAKPAFKPRAVKKPDNYRDRAAERRGGVAGDYAQVCYRCSTVEYKLKIVRNALIQVEALAEDFERRNADQDRKTVSPPMALHTAAQRAIPKDGGTAQVPRRRQHTHSPC